MSRTLYEIYREQVFVLAKTLIVKHEEIALAINEELYYRGFYNETDINPYNWRYYLNLSGEYHDYDRAKLELDTGYPYMRVRIATADGFDYVPFTKELIHGVNADNSLVNEFNIGSKYFEDLVNQYPEFEMLIIGILNPIDIETALKANNGEILYIDGHYKRIEDEHHYFVKTGKSKNLIQDQEHNLIEGIQKYFYDFLFNWNNREYMVGNDLYVITMIGILYVYLPNIIMNIRLGNCKTTYAHTFHIKEYLESRGQIGRYIDFIPIESALWLYRNAVWLESNSGKQLTFNSLVDNLYTPNDVPISAYSIRHDLTDMGFNRDSNKLLPTAMLYKEPINFEIPGASDDDRTVRDILEDEIPLARDNYKDLNDKENKIKSLIEWSGDDRLNTKVLETEIINPADPFGFTLEGMLFNLWGYTAVKGYYTGSVYVTSPVSGERLGFTGLNAYILCVYCLNVGIANKKLSKIPSVGFFHIPRTNNNADLPTDKRYEPKPTIEKAWGWCVQNVTRRHKVVEMFGNSEPVFYSNSAEVFYKNVKDMYDEKVRRYYTYCDTEEFQERGDLHLIEQRLYWNGFQESLADALTYEEWFNKIGIDLSDYTPEDTLALGLDLIASACGITTDEELKRKWLQKAIVAITKHFVSYTVQIIEKFAEGKVVYLEGQVLRFSNWKWEYLGGLAARFKTSLDYSPYIKLKGKLRWDVSNVFDNAKINLYPNLNISWILSGINFIGRNIKNGGWRYQLGVGIINIGGYIVEKKYDPLPSPPPEEILNEYKYINSNTYPLDIPVDSLGTAITAVRASVKSYPILTGDEYVTDNVDDVDPVILTTIKYTNNNIQSNLINQPTYDGIIDEYKTDNIDDVVIDLVTTIKYTKNNMESNLIDQQSYDGVVDNLQTDTINDVDIRFEYYPFIAATAETDEIKVGVNAIRATITSN